MKNRVIKEKSDFHSRPALKTEATFKRVVDPAVKAWLGNVLVPAMVQQYITAADQREYLGSSLFEECAK
jgi:hypothetical protein